MTGGRVVVLGRTGRNFAAGMSGGIAYVYDPADNFRSRCNREMVELEDLDADDASELSDMLRNHVRETGSTLAESLLKDWDVAASRFVKVIPRDYKRVRQAEAKARAESREPAFNELVGAANG